MHNYVLCISEAVILNQDYKIHILFYKAFHKVKINRYLTLKEKNHTYY